jgi:hypothetical protein
MLVPSSHGLGLTFVAKALPSAVSTIFTYGGQRDSTLRTAKATSGQVALKDSVLCRRTVIACVSWANDQDQPVAATESPMCVQPIGNSAASFCSAIAFLLHSA